MLIRDVTPGKGRVLIVAAGTSDLPVAEEAARTAELMGNEIDRLYDVGVAGLHRLLGERARLDTARVIIVVAGMEGALPSVVSGLVGVPVIAVPTSIGYGASFGGLAALLEPHYLRIGGYWYPRGGIPIDVFWQTGELPAGVWLPEQGVASYRGRG